MQVTPLKLKQASAVLGIPAKDLQNFVQFGVVKAKRREGLYRFDEAELLQAKIGWYLRASLGVSTGCLVRFVQLASKAAMSGEKRPQFIWLRSRPSPGSVQIEVKIPVRSLAKEIEERLPLAEAYKDLPRGRRRRGWKTQFLNALGEAAIDIGTVGKDDILRAVRNQRRTTRAEPEITVASKAKSTSA
jgi:hypothetical protein